MMEARLVEGRDGSLARRGSRRLDDEAELVDAFEAYTGSGELPARKHIP